ncbi:CIA30 family protein [Malonomonas rubra]|uniref:CIA30 family protein n=1 Tax=Malonomonas rubra TaxID=57040 RepID=UPI0026EF6930|nr:CIA30 family protein [Malonomonas rubra]
MQQPLWRKVGEALLLSLLLGASTELLQSLIGREGSWLDLGNDLLGSLLVLTFFGEWKAKLNKRLLWLLRGGLAFLVFWVVLPFVKVAADDLVAWQQFPLLSGFETPLEASRWGGDCIRRLDRQHVYSGSNAMQVELTTNRYSGVWLRHFPADWRGYRAVQFHIYNPQKEPFRYYFRIHDQFHRDNGQRYSDRFNATLVAQPGWNEVEIPLQEVAQAPRGRQLDLSRVAGMILFVGKLEQTQTFYLDEVRLVL